MQSGFHTFWDSEHKLAMAIVDTKNTRWMQPVDVTGYLIGFVEYDFSLYWDSIEALYELPIFDEGLDISFEDYADCAELCRDIAEGLADPVGAHFLCRELDGVAARPDNGSASYWLYQARDMIETLRTVVHAHTFLSHAFDLCFTDSGKSLPERARAFFKAYPDLEEHTFRETFAFLPSENGRMHYEHTLRLTKELGTRSDDYYAVLHQGRETLSVVRGNLIRTHRELFFFCLMELFRRGARIQRCEYCGGYFIPRTRKKTLYCDRVIQDRKTCKDIAPKRKQQLQKEQDATLQEFERIYNMYYARAERYECRTDLHRERTEHDLTYDEFYLWSERARKKRSRYLAGEIGAEKLLENIYMADSQVGQ